MQVLHRVGTTQGSVSKAATFSWSDALAYGMCIVTLGQVIAGAAATGSREATLALLANPLLGGPPVQPSEPPTSCSSRLFRPDNGTCTAASAGLPLWTYSVGHIVGGAAVLLVVAAILIPLLELSNARAHEQLRGKRDDLRGLAVTAVALVGSASTLSHVHKYLAEGGGLFYYKASEHGGWPTILVISALQLCVAETHYYWYHRLGHAAPFYDWIHRVHHSFVPTTAFAAEAWHPLDLTAMAMGTAWVPLLLPVYHPSYLGVLALNAVWSVFMHTGGRSDLGIWLLHDSHTHGIHHDYGRRPMNCGSITTIWDRAMGTYSREIPSWARTKWKGKGL